MKTRHLPFVALFIAAPVLAQHDDHVIAEPVAAADPHAGHTMPAETPPAETIDPHAGHNMPPSENTQEAEANGQSAMDNASGLAGLAPETAPPPEAFSGPAHAADTVFDPLVMSQARELVRSEHGDFRSYWLMADQLETRAQDGNDMYQWDAQGWYGGDINKLWVKTEGEGDFQDRVDQIELQALWSHAIFPWFDFQAGVRHDFRPGPETNHLVLGLQGLAPYQFEVDAAAFLSDDGDLSARLESEYDLWLTQRFILQPRLEFEVSAQDVPEQRIGSGLTTGELGLRLRYQLAREFSPYIGVEYEHLFGDTAKFAKADGNHAGGWNFIMGIRLWY